MGDSGALLLGYIIAATSIIGVFKSAITISIFLPLILLAIPIYDTTSTIIRRINEKKPLFRPDNDHIHHRLKKIGLSPKQIALIFYLKSFILGFTTLALTVFKSTIAIIVSILIISLTLITLRLFTRSSFINKNQKVD